MSSNKSAQAGKKSAPRISLPWDSASGSNLPDCQTHTSEWLRATDLITKRRYDPSLPLEPDITRGKPFSFYDSLINEDVLQEIVGARRISSTSDLHLSRAIVDLLTEQNFEQKWLSLGTEGQEKILLEAFRKHEVNSGQGEFTMMPGKIDCPELCYDNLTKNGGKGFVDLLQFFILENNDISPTQPIIVPNARFDALIGWVENDTVKNRKIWLGSRRFMRSRYISDFVGIVLATYDGREVTYIAYTHEHSKTKETLKGIRPVVDEFVGSAAGSKWQKEQAHNRKEMKLFCDACLKPEEKSETGKMSVCVRCKAVGREVRYCNRECQKAAWKNHKPGCGKPIDSTSVFEDVAPVVGTTNVASRPDLTPVAPGYRRSSNLVRLISYLNDVPSKDYLIFLPDGDVSGISLDEVQGASVFVHMRNRAMSMAPGTEGALFYMYRVLQRFSSREEGGEKLLTTQLSREYGETWVTLNKALRRAQPPKIDEVRREELDEVLGMLKKLGRFKEQLKGYVPGTGPSLTIAMQVGLTRDVTIMAQFPKELLSPVNFTLYPMPTTPVHVKKTVGPNFALPKPTTREDYIRYPGLERQIQFLQRSPEADYILWGHVNDPTVPYALTFHDLMDALSFISYRHRLFEHGAFDLDALVFLILSLEPVIRARKFTMQALYAQLESEYGEGYVKWALDSIVRRPDGKDAYLRRDGKLFEKGEIPAKQKDFEMLLKELKNVGRFAALLKRANLDALGSR